MPNLTQNELLVEEMRNLLWSGLLMPSRIEEALTNLPEEDLSHFLTKLKSFGTEKRIEGVRSLSEQQWASSF